MTQKLSSLLDFITLTHQIREVQRAMWVKDKEQFENDSEHGYQVALAALYLIEAERLQLDSCRAMALALVHDISEVLAGDTPVFGNAELVASQRDRERAAIDELRQRWPQMSLLFELIEEYEARETAESKFVYALDKLVPMLNNYLDKGRNWRREHITLEQVITAKSGKVAVDPVVKTYYDHLVTCLHEQPELFN